VKWLLARGFAIDGYVKGASTPLILATKNGNGAMALYLITRGADVNFKRYNDSMSALQLSITERNAELARILLEHGADPNSANNRNYTALHGAIGRCDVPTTLVLLEFGADPSLKNDRGETPRQGVVQCDSRESWDPGLAALSSLYAE